MTKNFPIFKSIVIKDLRLALRLKESFVSMAFFSLLVVLIFQFSLTGKSGALVPMVLPVVWLALLFGGTLKMARCFEAENEGSLFDVFRLVKHGALFLVLSKVLVNFIFMLVLAMTLLLLAVILFNLNDAVGYLTMIAPVLFLGLFGLVIIGTIFSAMVISHTRREMILPVISYPILIPVIVGVINALEYDVSGFVVGVKPMWVEFLVAFDLIYLILSAMVAKVLIDSSS